MYRGYFINLARSRRRRTALLRHLDDIGAAARYERVEAVDGRAVAADFPSKLDPGSLGVWLSHEALLRACRSADRHLHVIEDDTLFAKSAGRTLDLVLRQADEQLSWDLLFTEIFIPFSVPVFRHFEAMIDVHARSKRYALVDLAGIGFAGATSFFINRNAIEKYAALIKGQWALGMPIDLFIRRLVHDGALRAYVTVPFLTSFSNSVASTVRGRLTRSHQVCNVVRRGFFEDADRRALQREMRTLTNGARLSELASLFAAAGSFAVSDRWTPF